MPTKKRRVQVTWKQGKSPPKQKLLSLPVVALNLKMIDRRLAKAGLRELQDVIQDDGVEVWLKVKDAMTAFDQATQYFSQNPESLPFSDLAEKDLRAASKVLLALPPRASVRFNLAE